MADLNLAAAWTGILLGMAGGAALGLFFHGEEWLGGDGACRRGASRYATSSSCPSPASPPPPGSSPGPSRRPS